MLRTSRSSCESISTRCLRTWVSSPMFALHGNDWISAVVPWPLDRLGLRSDGALSALESVDDDGAVSGPDDTPRTCTSCSSAICPWLACAFARKGAKDLVLDEPSWQGSQRELVSCDSAITLQCVSSCSFAHNLRRKPCRPCMHCLLQHHT